MSEKLRKLRKCWVVGIAVLILLTFDTTYATDLIFEKGDGEIVVIFTEEGILATNVNVEPQSSITPIPGDLLIKYSGDNKLFLSPNGVNIKKDFEVEYEGDDDNLPAGLVFINKNRPENKQVQAACSREAVGGWDDGDLIIRKTKYQPYDGYTPNYVRTFLYQETNEQKKIILTRYTDGTGRNIQNQLKIENYNTLLSGTYYDAMNRPVKMNKPYATFGSLHYYPMVDQNGEHILISGANEYFTKILPGDKEYALTKMQYFEDPLSRTHAIGNPGAKYSLDGQHSKTWHFGVPDFHTEAIREFIEINDFLKPQKLNDQNLNNKFPNVLKAELGSYNEGYDFYLIVTKDPNDNYTQKIVDKLGNVLRAWAYALPNEGDNYDNPTNEKIIVADYQYDVMGNVLQEFPPEVENSSHNSDVGATTYLYNTLNQVIEKWSPDAGNKKYEYDDAGRLVRINKADGITQEFVYDDLGRIITVKEKQGAVSTERIKKYYDNTAELSSFGGIEHLTSICEQLTNLRGKLVAEMAIYNIYQIVVDAYSYDNAGRLSAIYKYIPTVGWTKIVFTYKLLGDLEIKSVFPKYNPEDEPDPIITKYEYDEQGRISALKDGSGNTRVTYTYTQTGQLANKEFHNNKTKSIVATCDYAYNIRDWVTNLNSKNMNRTTEFSEGLDYDGQYNGNISGADYYYRDAVGGNKTVNLEYAYDGVNRLTSVNEMTGEDQYKEAFAYDNVGRIEQKVAGTNELNNTNKYYYETGKNRLRYVDNGAQINGNYTYDASGNMIKDDSKDMDVEWDWRDMAQKFTLRGGPPPSGDGAFVEMFYDASGNRVMKIERNETDAKAVAYVGDELVYETDDIDAQPFKLTNVYISSSGGIEGRIDFEEGGNTTAYFYLKDHLGTTRSVIADNSSVAKADMYFAYGSKSPVIISDLKNRKEFTGKEFDDDGATISSDNGMNLYYFGARYFDPEIIMWTSPDPADQFWNSYSYCGGNPIRLIDPKGMKTEESDKKSWWERFKAFMGKHATFGKSTRARVQARQDIYKMLASHSPSLASQYAASWGGGSGGSTTSGSYIASLSTIPLAQLGKGAAIGMLTSYAGVAPPSGILNIGGYAPLSMAGSSTGKMIAGAKFLSGSARVAGISLFTLSAGISVIQGGVCLYQGNYPAASKSGLDIIMGFTGLSFPFGTTIAGSYFIIDVIPGGWPAAFEAQSKLHEQDKKAGLPISPKY